MAGCGYCYYQVLTTNVTSLQLASPWKLGKQVPAGAIQSNQLLNFEVCYTCDEGYVLVPGTGRCSACPTGCSTCYREGGVDNCSKCNSITVEYNSDQNPFNRSLYSETLYEQSL